MWLSLAFLSALLLGFYDLAKKVSLRGNNVLLVLLLNTLFCSLLFTPGIIGSFSGLISEGDLYYVPWNYNGGQPYIVLKSIIVLSSWVLGYYGIKDLPLTIVGTVNSTRPMMALLGAMLLFGERLNVWQWVGVLLAFFSLYLLSQASKKEGINFRHNHSVWCVILAAVLGACSSLYDKFLMAPVADGGLGLDRNEVLGWYNIYQFVWMSLIVLGTRAWRSGVFRWGWSIVLISVFLIGADYAYMTALSCDGALVSIVSMVRRSNVIVSFLFGIILLGEQNWRRKAFDLALVALGMAFVWYGTR